VESLHESFEDFRLNEIGDGGSKPFKFIQKKKIEPTLDKEFKSSSKGGDWSNDVTIPYIVRGDKANYKVKITCNVKPKIQMGHPKYRNKIVFKGDLQCNVGFDEAGESDEATTNYNEQYRLMATVSNIVIEFMESIEKTWHLTEMYILPKADKGEKEDIDNKRGKFYEAYLRKQINRLKNPYTVMTKTLYHGAQSSEGFVITRGHWSGSGGGKTGYIRND